MNIYLDSNQGFFYVTSNHTKKILTALCGELYNAVELVDPIKVIGFRLIIL